MTDQAHAAAVDGVVHLGKLDVKQDSRNLLLAHYLDDTTALPAVPASTDWSQKVASWPMYGNDKLGDCTCAAVGHIEEAWSANAGAPFVAPEQAVLDLYWATGTHDTGRACLDILRFWHKKGFDEGHEITAFAQVDPQSQPHVEFACWAFGGVYIGLAMPVSAQSQSDEWTVSSGADAQAGSWGGHCVNLVDYDAKGPTCVTWGRLMPMSWEFFAEYCDESYAVISPDFLGGGDAAPSGFDLAQLKHDLAAVKSK